MSDLEDEAKPILVPMFAGRTVVMHGLHQAVVAQWLYKTAITVALTHDHEATKIPRAHYPLFFERRTLPGSTQVWLGRLEPREMEGATLVQRFEWWHRESRPEDHHEGYAILISVLGVVGLVIVLDAPQSSSESLSPIRPAGRLLERFNRIWPASAAYSAMWPPRVPLSEGDLAELMDGFRRAGGEPVPVGITPGSRRPATRFIGPTTHDAAEQA